MSLGPLCVLLEEVSIQALWQFCIGLLTFLMWSYVTRLYILEIKPLSKVLLANTFSHTVGSLFILLMFSLAVQKLLNLINSHFLILSCMFHAIGDISLKILVNEISEIFLCSPLGLL